MSVSFLFASILPFRKNTAGIIITERREMMEIIAMPIGDIVAYKNNPRINDKAGLRP